MTAGMSPLPSALLSKFYERESLRNTDTGFELCFKNRLAPSTIVAIGPLTVDGYVYESDQLSVSFERPAQGHRPPPEPVARTAKDFEKKGPKPFDINAILRVSVMGTKLSPGSHQVTWTFRTKEVGAITVTAEDLVFAE